MSPSLSTIADAADLTVDATDAALDVTYFRQPVKVLNELGIIPLPEGTSAPPSPFL